MVESDVGPKRLFILALITSAQAKNALLWVNSMQILNPAEFFAGRVLGTAAAQQGIPGATHRNV
jgi:hypothetical protein